MTQIMACTSSSNSLTVVLRTKQGIQPHNISKSHPNFARIEDKVKKGDAKDLEDLINIAKAVTKWGTKGSQGKVTVKNGAVMFNDEVLHNSLTSRILSMISNGDDASALINFLERVQANPSYTSRQELFDFLAGNNLPITPEGMFLAYKKVRDNYKDKHSNTMDNSPGKVVSMERGKVDDKRENTCSYGLHFASLEYAKNFGSGRMVVLEIDPADVVSIPVDYKNQKGRACKYKVVGEVGHATIEKVDVLEQHTVVDNKDYNPKKETYEEFLSRKAGKQRRDSSGRFIKTR